MRERLVDDMLVGGTSVVVCWAQACGDRAAGLEVNFQKSETIEQRDVLASLDERSKRGPKPRKKR
jgi:hypothetical protein